MNILVTGGAGYIGSHTLVELYKAGHTAVVVDNLSNSNVESLRRVESILNDEMPNRKVAIPFYNVDIRDRKGLESVFEHHSFDACIHFAGLKAVGESVEKPWEYYENNIGGTLTLVDEMRRHGCRNIIFSSSATVYGDPDEIPITENCPKGLCTNPYGWTKSMIEQMLTDIQKSENEWNVVLLRYFNPVGAHPGGSIGECPNGIPNNLMPYITQVAMGKRLELGVFGNDYPTPDGTGVRDYIHVCDLATAHVCALRCFNPLFGHSDSRPFIYNIGTGRGYSVLDVVNAFERVNGVAVPYRIKSRRAGDIAACYCDPSKAKSELGWTAKYNLDDMVRDSWRWQQQNPDGYNATSDMRADTGTPSGLHVDNGIAPKL